MHRHNLHSSNAETLRVLRPKPCGFSTPRPRIAKQYVYTPSRGVTLGSLDSQTTRMPLRGIRGRAYSERYASRLGIHVWREPYVCAPSGGATREACDSGRFYLLFIYFSIARLGTFFLKYRLTTKSKALFNYVILRNYSLISSTFS